MAAAGIPSHAAVLSRLSGNVDAIVAATRNPDDGDWIDRAVSGLRGFVKCVGSTGKAVAEMRSWLARKPRQNGAT